MYLFVYKFLKLNVFVTFAWRRKWQPTPLFLPGKSHGQRSLVGYSPWARKRVSHDIATKQGNHLLENISFFKFKDGSIQFSFSVMSNSLQPHGLQHARLPCSSPIPRAYSNSCPSSQWWHPTISSSVIPFFFHLQSIQHQGLFQLVSSSYQVANVLEFQLQHQSFQWVFRVDFL